MSARARDPHPAKGHVQLYKSWPPALLFHASTERKRLSIAHKFATTVTSQHRAYFTDEPPSTQQQHYPVQAEGLRKMIASTSALLVSASLFALAQGLDIMGCGDATAQLNSVDSAALCESPASDSRFKVYYHEHGPIETHTGPMNDNSALPEFSYTTKEEADCPSVCTTARATVPAQSQCYTWTYSKDAGESWRFWGYEIESQSDEWGPRVVLCKGACRGFANLEC